MFEELSSSIWSWAQTISLVKSASSYWYFPPKLEFCAISWAYQIAGKSKIPHKLPTNFCKYAKLKFWQELNEFIVNGTKKSIVITISVDILGVGWIGQILGICQRWNGELDSCGVLGTYQNGVQYLW